MRLARETIINFIGTVLTSVAGFIATVVIARLLGAEALGIYALGLSLIFWLDIPATGFQQALMKRISEGTDRATYFSTGLATNVGIIAAVGGLMFLFQDSVRSYVGADVIPLLVLLMAANTLFGTIISGLQAQKRVGLSGLIRALERTLRTLSQVALILLSYAVGGLMIGHAASLALSSLIALFFYSFDFAWPRLDHLRRLVEYAKYAWVSNLQGKAYSWLDTLVLGLFVAASLIGIYEVAWSLASVLVLLNKSIMQTLFPEVSELNEAADYEAISSHLREALAFSGITMVPGFVGAAIIGPELLKIYSSEFTKGAEILLILIFARMMNSVAELFFSTIYALDRPDLGFRIAVPVLLSNLVLNLILISQIGWYGAAIATALTGVLNLILTYVVLSRLVDGIAIPAGEISRQVGASTIMGLVVWALTRWIPSNHYATVGVVAAGALVYAVVLSGISPRFRQKFIRVIGSFS